MKKYIIITLFILSIIACKNSNTEDQKPVAKIMDKYLFFSEIKDIVPNDSSKEDSIIIANSYIKQWITKQLLLYKAELNLSNKEKDITKLINDYRASILIHRYKEKLIGQKLNLNFTNEELENYYNQYKFNFSLSENIVKALYIKLPINAPNLKRLTKIYRSSKAKDLEELENYCLLNATKYDHFNDAWIPASVVLNKLPITYTNEIKYLKNHKYIEVKDEEYVYFVKINDVKYVNSQAPFEYITKDLIEIVKNKKRLEFEVQLEKEINKEAKEQNLYTIY